MFMSTLPPSYDKCEFLEFDRVIESFGFELTRRQSMANSASTAALGMVRKRKGGNGDSRKRGRTPTSVNCAIPGGCYECGGPHFARDCPNKAHDEGSSGRLSRKCGNRSGRQVEIHVI